MIHNHGGQRRRWIEQAAIHHQNPNILRLHSCLLQQLIDSPEHHHLRLLPGLLHTWVWRDLQHGLGHVGVLPEAGALQNLLLKRQVLIGEAPRQLGPVHENLARAHALRLGLVTRKVKQIHFPRPGGEVEGGEEDYEAGADGNGDEVELELVPQTSQVLDG